MRSNPPRWPPHTSRIWESITRLAHRWRRTRPRPTGETQQTVETLRVRFRGQTLRLLVRPGTTDLDLVAMALREQAMYPLPKTVQPSVIFDAGANIGITALYFALQYPKAQLYGFEPLPENLELLRHNTRCLGDRIQILPYGLSDRNGTFDYHMSDNPCSFGGGGFMQIGHDPSRKRSLPLKTVPDAMAELGLHHVDLFKLDTEGAELAILRSIPSPVRTATQAFVGELHGIGDWEVCQTLARSHAIGVQKAFHTRCFPFIAVRRDLANPAVGAKKLAA